jgi:hypothetical protein
MTQETDLSPKTPAELGIPKDVLDEASEILHPFEMLLPVRVLDTVLWLPENNSLWRGLQFWGLVKREVRIDFSLFCISGSCKKCKSLVQEPGASERQPLLLCQTKAQPGIHIAKLAAGFSLRKVY